MMTNLIIFAGLFWVLAGIPCSALGTNLGLWAFRSKYGSEAMNLGHITGAAILGLPLFICAVVLGLVLVCCLLVENDEKQSKNFMRLDKLDT